MTNPNTTHIDPLHRPSELHQCTDSDLDQTKYNERTHATDLSNSDLVELRAAQRTFEGAYVRTSLSQFSFALIILKIFTSEFYSIGALFAVYGACVLIVSAYRRHQGNRQFFSEVGDDGLARKRFKTSGNVVLVLSALSLAAYIILLVLTLKLDRDDEGQ